MDNTTITIIGMIVTAYVTVVGMIAAFITAIFTAFLAEPVKTHYENKNKSNNIKKALYKELISNFRSLNIQKEKFSEFYIDLTIHYTIRTEYYKYVIQNESTLFYQLPESTIINSLFNTFLIPFQQTINNDTLFNKKVRAAFAVSNKNFIQAVAFYFYSGDLDKELLKELVPLHEYNLAMKKGAEEQEDFIAKAKQEFLSTTK